MPRLLSAFVASAFIVFAGGAALAAPPQPSSWSGWYAGGFTGYGTGADQGCGAWNGGSTYLPVNSATDCNVDPSNHNYENYGPFHGVLGGVQVGRNFQFDSFVFGGELAAELLPLNHHSPSADISEKTGPVLTATIHGGYTTGPLYFYGLVGYANTNQQHDDNVSDCHWNVNLGGLVYGAGVQSRISSKLSVFGEWNHLDFGTDRATCINELNNTNNLDKTTGDLFKVGLNVHFN
jgi:opacity protein-like surface antigen